MPKSNCTSAVFNDTTEYVFDACIFKGLRSSAPFVWRNCVQFDNSACETFCVSLPREKTIERTFVTAFLQLGIFVGGLRLNSYAERDEEEDRGWH